MFFTHMWLISADLFVTDEPNRYAIPKTLSAKAESHTYKSLCFFYLPRPGFEP